MKIVNQYEFGTSDVLIVEEQPIPIIEDGQILIKGIYTSINYADIKKRIGNKGEGNFPITLGLDIAGIVEESKSKHFKKGDRVIAFPARGTYAQYVISQENLTYKIPNELSFEQAAAMPTVSFLAAILLEEIGTVKQHDTVIIHSAAGGVGSMLVQLAKHLNVHKTIATVGSSEKFEYVNNLGADIVCTYEDFVDVTLNETDHNGANVIFDSIAGEITSNSLRCLDNYGTLVQFGNSSGIKGKFTTADVHSSCRSIKGFSLGTTRQLRPEFIRPYAEKMISYFAKGIFELSIDKIFDLSDVKEAHAYFESRKHRGKILLKIQ